MDVFRELVCLLLLAITAHAWHDLAGKRQSAASHKHARRVDLIRKDAKKLVMRSSQKSHAGMVREMETVVMTEEGTITSPGYPHPGYGDNLDLTWIIIPPTSQVVRLGLMDLFLEFGEECEYDSLHLYEGDELWSELCGLMGPFTYYSPTNLTIVFHSNHALSERGFKFDVQFEPNEDKEMLESICADHVVQMTEEGVIVSPNYGFSTYPSSLHCLLQILAPPQKHVRLDFVFLAVEMSRACECDVLSIHDMQYQQYHFCSDNTPSPIISEGQSLQLSFHSDGRTQHNGFYINVTFTTQAADSLAAISDPCPGPLEILLEPDQPVTLLSPGYDEGAYYHSSRCFWNIRAPHNNRIRLTVLEMDIENSWRCIYDVLEIYEGMSLGGRLCGRQVPDNPLLSFRNELDVEFFTDFTVSEGYWKLLLEAV